MIKFFLVLYQIELLDGRHDSCACRRPQQVKQIPNTFDAHRFGSLQRWNIFVICLSKSVRSVTMAMDELRSFLRRRSLTDRQSIVKLFPDPCVAQTTPPRSFGVLPVKIRSTAFCLVDDKVLDHVQQILFREHARY